MRGVVYLVFGQPDMTHVELSDVRNGTGGFLIRGEAAEHTAGRSVRGGHDVDGDGLDDIVLGARDSDQSGTAYLVFGKATTETVELTDVRAGMGGFVMDVDEIERAGDAVALVPDTSGDGVPDIVIGAPRAAGPPGFAVGKTYVVHGKADGTPVDLADIEDGIGGYVIHGEADSGECGWAVSSAGDIDGDGLSDLLMSAPYVDLGEPRSGRAYLVLGKTSTEAVELSDVLNGDGGLMLEPPDTGLRFGVSLDGGMDISGDGTSDLVIGIRFGGADHAGAVYVVFGESLDI